MHQTSRPSASSCLLKNRVVTLSAVASLAMFCSPTAAHSAVVLQSNFNPAGSGGTAAYWNTPSMWSDGLAPATGNTYESRTQVANIGNSYTLNGTVWNYRGQIRDTNGPTPVTSTFGGDSLTLTADTRLLLKGRLGITSTANIVMANDSHIFLAPDTAAGSRTSTLAGTLHVAGTLTGIGVRSNGGETFNITSTITGASGTTLQMVLSGGQVNHMAINGTYSAYAGTFYLGTPTTGDSPTTAAGSTFSFAAGSAPSATLQLETHANYKFNLNSDVTFGNIIVGAGPALALGTYDWEDLNTLGYGSSFLDNGGTLTVIPEPSAATFALLASGALLFRRRH